MSSTTKLTDEQRRAAEHMEGPLLILAGPGSGKTRVVTHRIANMLRWGIPPENILALTFTNKAATEMRRRVEELVPGQSVWISTFHRFCARLLRDHAALVGLAENFTIYDSSDSQRALQHALDGLGDLNLDQVTPAKLLREIGRCKNSLVTADAYQCQSRSVVGVLLGEVYPAYQQQLMQSNAVDFDDLLLHTVELLRNNESLRCELDARYQQVMVDEYQDTNLAQYAIVRALSIDHPNLAVTGDPDQSIYGWRGANIRNILDFEKDYPHVNVVRLEHNFRSTPEILAVADQLIRHNVQRKAKSLIPTRESQAPVNLLAFPSQQDEACYITEQIASAVAKGERRYRDFAIFYRVNALSRYLEHALHERQIPYQVLNGVAFYQRKEVKDLMAYLQLINNPSDDMALLRIINTPSRGIGRTTLSRLGDVARDRRVPMFEAASQSIPSISNRPAASLRRFTDLIRGLSHLATSPVEEILRRVLSETGYEEQLREGDDQEDEDRLANVHELVSAARQFDMLHPGSDYLDAFLEQTALVSDTDAWEEDNDKVTLMTLHASKGLEFPVVFLVAVEQGKLPHERSREDPDQLEEERRLMFVGLTRAEDSATVSYAKYRDQRGMSAPTIASPFLMELPRELMNVVEPGRAGVETYDEWNQDHGLDEFADIEFFDDTSEAGLEDASIEFDPSTFATFEESPGSDVTFHRPVPLSTASTLVASAELDSSSESRLGPTGNTPEPPITPPDPDAFLPGMRVQHPDYGLGKVTALSGSGKKRTAKVAFVIAGEKTFILAKSTLRPLK